MIIITNVHKNEKNQFEVSFTKEKVELNKLKYNLYTNIINGHVPELEPKLMININDQHKMVKLSNLMKDLRTLRTIKNLNPSQSFKLKRTLTFKGCDIPKLKGYIKIVRKMMEMRARESSIHLDN